MHFYVINFKCINILVSIEEGKGAILSGFLWPREDEKNNSDQSGPMSISEHLINGSGFRQLTRINSSQ